jgi:hypothetical protein
LIKVIQNYVAPDIHKLLLTGYSAVNKWAALLYGALKIKGFALIGLPVG